MLVKPICFMVMPYGIKAVGTHRDPAVPAEVDFDRLWQAALKPSIEDLGYEPVRADQDLGALIIQEMLERLAISDVVVADVTIANANVYYEIGIRHAAKEIGCVMIAAEWAKPLFDINQMRQIRYTLPAKVIDDATAAEIKGVLKEGIPRLAAGASPFYSALPGFPTRFDEKRASSFKETLLQLARFQGQVAAIRTGPRGERAERTLRLRDQYGRGPIMHPVAFELLYLLRDFASPEDTLQFIANLPQDLQALPLVLEQKALVQSNAGKHAEAISTLEELIFADGETAERRGLLGGRYKRLHDEATDAIDRETYLNLAIENYDRGMHLDLNDYYPASNLALLYKQRNHEGDADRARVAAAITLVGCQRSLERNPSDEWVKSVMLVAAFDAGDVDAARDLAVEVRSAGAAAWKLRSVIADLERAVELHEPELAARMRPIVDGLKQLL